ncbi:MAG TPA: DEAD/DEAH box helicase [Candidatus Limnocylindrales bacterium]|nr:DEAD/DEAH box helicase [Candidatus Limnocylindrales bacterium]
MNDLSLLPSLVDAVADMGYSEPTPIQAQAIPVVLAGRDLIACAATGTGKTAAFMLPVLQLLSAGDAGRCRALVLSPTRELALQIDEQAQALGYYVGLSAAPVVGGVDMGPQERALRAGAAMVVATPGRLLDHMRFGYVDLAAVEIVILDEADRMLDMGFLPDIQRILEALPAKRQTLLFSATMSPTIRKLAGEILRDPVTVTVDRQAPAAAIVQSVCAVSQDRKTALLSRLLRREGMDSVLVFVRRKIDADRLARAVTRGGVRATSIHSDRSQEARIAALDGFRSGEFPVLIATDVAARGLDVSGISHVINFDVPHSSEDYIHRAGRTARAGAAGDVITFVAPEEEERLREIERALGMKLPRREVAGSAPAARSADDVPTAASAPASAASNATAAHGRAAAPHGQDRPRRRRRRRSSAA